MFFLCSFSVLNDLNSRYHQCLQKASELKQLVEPGLQSLDGKAMTVSSFTQTNRFFTDTAISRMLVGKSARDNPERYCGWFWVLCSSRKFKIMSREAMELCLL